MWLRVVLSKKTMACSNREQNISTISWEICVDLCPTQPDLVADMFLTNYSAVMVCILPTYYSHSVSPTIVWPAWVFPYIFYRQPPSVFLSFDWTFLPVSDIDHRRRVSTCRTAEAPRLSATLTLSLLLPHPPPALHPPPARTGTLFHLHRVQ